MPESRGLCFTGCFNRLVSVLADFFGDISIEISDNARIGGIVLAAKARASNSKEHAELARSMLTDAGYDTRLVQPWLEAISEP